MAGISPYGRGCFSTSLRSYGKAFRFSSSLSSQSRRPAREQSSLLAHLHIRKKAVLRRTLFSTCGDGGNRSLSWIFYFVITYKISHSLDPHSGARTVVRLRAPSVRFPPSGQTKSPSVFTLGSFVCCPLGGSVRNNFIAVARKFSRPHRV